MINILFVNSVEKQCGCQSYGERSFNILKNSKKYNFIYCEPKDLLEYGAWVNNFDPHGVIFNYHPLTMPWVPDLSYYPRQTHLVLWHEGSEHTNLNPDYWLYVDSVRGVDEKGISLPRPLIEVNMEWGKWNTVPVIGSFGMAFGNKGFGRIVKMVNDQFDEAIIKLHLPRAYYGDRMGEARAGVIPGCYNEKTKPGIKIEITEEFLNEEKLLLFLYGNDVNVFLYDEMYGRGLSSVIDYALSANTPIAINDSWMFRHIQKPEINVANKTLQEIIDQGVEPLKEFRELWSNKNFLEKYESILDQKL